jgi:hypothetical protein
MAADVELVWLAAKAGGVPIDPGNAAADLLRHNSQIAARRFDGDEIESQVMGAGLTMGGCREVPGKRCARGST